MKVISNEWEIHEYFWTDPEWTDNENIEHFT